ncbi:beta-eliminating lyase-related protein [uncultured Pseudomonas sp.]|uniref:threonine aldolase family protein n=1 Tax=uncultured Pseudomonas sp. TaxID=114707 RepID=UPI0030D7E0CC|tara:strand:+ start:5531 stop:6598 length:1068 start_codon:yes stop_codon:yes gene_type:complete
MNFASDNQSGVSPAVLQGIVEASTGVAGSYSNDQWTQAAVAQLSAIFEKPVQAFFVATGTASNCLALSALVQPWHSILCHSQAHIAVDELSAPELFTGGARLVLMGDDGDKLTAQCLSDTLQSLPKDRPHNQIPGALSITQCTESGLVYSVEEVRALTEVAHAADMRVHMDGARFSNALATLNCTPADITWKAGVDVLCLGASKNGALALEAVIFFDEALAKDFDLRRKRAGHLVSKGRLFGAQMCAWLKDDHWLTLARHANEIALALEQCLQPYPAIQIAWPVQANELFAVIPVALFEHLKAQGVRLNDWLPNSVPQALDIKADHLAVRFVTSFESELAEVQQLQDVLAAYFAS